MFLEFVEECGVDSVRFVWFAVLVVLQGLWDVFTYVVFHVFQNLVGDQEVCGCLVNVAVDLHKVAQQVSGVLTTKVARGSPDVFRGIFSRRFVSFVWRTSIRFM